VEQQCNTTAGESNSAAAFSHNEEGVRGTSTTTDENENEHERWGGSVVPSQALSTGDGSGGYILSSPARRVSALALVAKIATVSQSCGDFDVLGSALPAKENTAGAKRTVPLPPPRSHSMNSLTAGPCAAPTPSACTAAVVDTATATAVAALPNESPPPQAESLQDIDLEDIYISPEPATGAAAAARPESKKVYKFRKVLVPSQVHLRAWPLRDGSNDIEFDWTTALH
jgi:hypothetical protein